MHDDGSQLETKHVAMNKWIKTSAICDWFNSYSCDSLNNQT
jgi:hypothetical protein